MVRWVCTVAALWLAGCSCGGPVGASFEIVKPGEGPTNEQPLEPLKPGTTYGALAGRALSDGRVNVPGRGEAQRVSFDGLLLDAPSYVFTEAAGQFVVTELPDGGLSQPALRVPATVRLGMEWTTEISTGERVRYAVTKRAPAEPTSFGPRTAWTIALLGAEGAVLQERRYFEGLGQFDDGLVFHETTATLQPEVGAPLELEANGRFESNTVPGELSFIQLEDGTGLVLAQHGTVDPLMPRQSIGEGTCLRFEGGNLSKEEGELVPPWREGRLLCPFATSCNNACSTAGSPIVFGTDATGTVVKGQQVLSMPREAQRAKYGYTDRSIVGRINGASGLMGLFHLAPQGLTFSTSFDTVGEASLLERSDAWGGGTARDFVPNALLALATRAQVGRLVSFPQADGSVKVLLRAENDVLWNVTARADGSSDEPKMGERFMGRWSVAVRADGPEVLVLDSLGHVDRVLPTDDGPVRERLGAVKLPAGHSPLAVFRTGSGFLVFTAQRVEGATLTPFFAWKAGPFTASPVRVPRVPTVSVSQAEGFSEFEVCWPSEGGVPDGRGWTHGGVPVTLKTTTADAHCALLHSTQPSWTPGLLLEGTLPGYGRFSFAEATEQLTSALRGRSFLINSDTNTLTRQPIGAQPDGRFTNGHYVFDGAGLVSRSLPARGGTQNDCKADRAGHGVWCRNAGTKDFVLSGVGGLVRITLPEDPDRASIAVHAGGLLVRTRDAMTLAEKWYRLRADGTFTLLTGLSATATPMTVLRDGTLCVGDDDKLTCGTIEVVVASGVGGSPDVFQLDDTHLLVRTSDWVLVDLAARTFTPWAAHADFQAPFFVASDGTVWGRGGADTGELQLTPRWPVQAEVSGPRRVAVPKQNGAALVEDFGHVAANDDFVLAISKSRGVVIRIPRR